MPSSSQIHATAVLGASEIVPQFDDNTSFKTSLEHGVRLAIVFDVQVLSGLRCGVRFCLLMTHNCQRIVKCQLFIMSMLSPGDHATLQKKFSVEYDNPSYSLNEIEFDRRRTIDEMIQCTSAVGIRRRTRVWCDFCQLNQCHMCHEQGHVDFPSVSLSISAPYSPSGVVAPLSSFPLPFEQ